MNESVIEVNKLKKSFTIKKNTVAAINGVNFVVKRGEVFGFLGPNGAGKTTTLRMLATLLPIDDGEAKVAGIDVRRHPSEVRKHIGYVSQEGGADPEATGTEDLILQGRLYGMSLQEAQARAKELVELLQLDQFAERKIKTYSGGQKRRLNVASGIMHRPDVLFLDEPTTGLDPQNRANLWEQVRNLRDNGTTIFLTTHYLDEADNLCDHLVIIDNGKIAADGTPHELKAQIAGDAIVLKPKAHDRLHTLHTYLDTQAFVKEARIEGDTLRLYVHDGTKALPKIISLLDSRNTELETLTLSQPSLDDVFLMQTGRSLRDAHQEGVQG